MSRITVRADTLVEDVCTPQEAAMLLSKGVATIWRWIRDDKIITVKVGGRTLIPDKEIERLQKEIKV